MYLFVSQGSELGLLGPVSLTAHTTRSRINAVYTCICVNQHVFEKWEKTEVPGENPHRYEESM